MSADPPALWTVLPFVAMLLAVALGPVVAPHWWESNLHRLLVSCVLAAPVVVLYAGRPRALAHAVEEYASFVVLLAGLYAVAGGLVLRGDLAATPLTNTAFLAAGGVLASLIGTTGASMVLIRPLLHTNAERKHVWHTIVVFIFLVSNCGGMLTPLGDPPLFLGYLQGVPFTWTLRLWKPWLFLMAALLALHWVWDRWAFRREPAAAVLADRTRVRPLRLAGGLNLAWLGAIVLAVLLLPGGWREALIVAAAAAAWITTPAALRRENRFTAAPMLEVAAVFLGIFLTMLPALELLRARGGALGLREPGEFFWATGVLSAVLDNAPTYLALLAIAQGLALRDEVVGVTHGVLAGISLGAVCLGANSYIGNAPNFMVRAIAEEEGVAMPGFFAYMGYAAVILLPLYAVAAWLFL
jgi:Na+/H+ antiporter NhaD/arsenite permease-like protein